MKMVYLCNFTTRVSGFGFELKNTLALEGVESVLVDAEEFLMDLGNGTSVSPKLILNGEEVHVSGDLFFMKKRKPHHMYSSLLLQFVGRLGAEHMNTAFNQHHKNVDKQSQYINLVKNNLRIPRTLLICGTRIESSREYIESIFTYPFVLKASGSGGAQVWKVHNFEEVVAHVNSVSKKRNETLVLQEFIEESREEYRVLMCYEEPIAVIIRSSASFHNNYAQGGEVRSGSITEHELQLCIKAARISGLDYLGVDFMRSGKDGEPVFIELQTGPSLTVSKIANKKAVEDMARILKKKLTE